MAQSIWTNRSKRGDSEQEEANRVTASLAGLAMALFLVVIGLYLIHTLRTKAMIEDCLMASRTNCDQIVAEALALQELPS